MLAALLTVGLSVAACSSGSSTTTTVGNGPLLREAGTGSRTLTAVTLPTKWTATWRFNCTNPVTASRFKLTATKQGGTPITLTDQTGLGGGGSKAYHNAGSFVFQVTTSCAWTVTAGPTPAANSGSTSTT